MLLLIFRTLRKKKGGNIMSIDTIALIVVGAVACIMLGLMVYALCLISGRESQRERERGEDI